MIYSIIYILLNAVSAVLRQMSGDFLSPSYVLLIGSVCAVIFYHAINFRQIKIIYEKCMTHKSLLLRCNLSIALMWICAVYGPGMIGASLYTFLFFAVYGFSGKLLLLSQQNGSFNDKVSALSLLGLLSYVVISQVMQHAEMQSTLGMLLAVIGGVSGLFYSKQASDLMKFKLSASQLLAVRFYVTIILCVAMLIITKPPLGLNLTNLTFGLSTGILCLIIPVYFLQKSIEKVGPELNAIICSTMPFVSAILQQLYSHDVPTRLFIIYGLYGFLAVYPLINFEREYR